MFKRLLVVAFLLSMLTCVGWDLRAQRTLEARQTLLEQKRAQLRDFDREVQILQQQKRDLEIAIDALKRPAR